MAPSRINDAGLAIIKTFEGCRLHAYRCPAGILTIGYGHTGPDVVENMQIDEQKALELLKNDVSWAEKKVRALVTAGITENQFSALVSLTFNIGGGGLFHSKVLEHVNTNDPTGAADHFMDHVYARGVLEPLKGLVRRRKMEQTLFLS